MLKSQKNTLKLRLQLEKAAVTFVHLKFCLVVGFFLVF